MTAIYRQTTDASALFRERTASEVAGSASTAAPWSLSAVTKNATLPSSRISSVCLEGTELVPSMRRGDWAPVEV